MKKCRPIMRACVFRPLPISLIGKLDELLLRIVCGALRRSSSANTDCLSARSSRTFSTTSAMSAHGTVA